MPSSSSSMLLAVHCKKTDNLDLKTPINKYILSTYGQHQANDAADDLATVQTLRNDVAGLNGSLSTLKDTLAKYYRVLSLMETRFPISKDRDHISLGFTWYDAFKHTKKTEQRSIFFEKAAVLFNIGAVLTQQALACDRTGDAGLKDAARKFQEAAGIFAELRDVASPRVESPRPVDVSPECAAMLERLCLAQAQEVTFEKARADKKSPAILARLAKQVAGFYQEVAVKLQEFPLAQHFDKSWLLHVNAKAALYEVEVQMTAAQGLHDNDEVHIEIARLKEAQRLLFYSRKEVKQCSKELNEHLAALDAAATVNLAKAERENSTVYLQRVPAFADLPAIQPYTLVKALPPTDLDASNEGLFTDVIPDASAKAVSKYSELVDELIRGLSDQLAGASDEARLRLREWDLPDCLQALDAGTAAVLPEALRGELEALEECGGVRHLQDLAVQIKELRRVDAEELEKVERTVREEAATDAALKERHGSAWTRTPSVALNSQLLEKIAGYKANLAAAGESDSRLEARLNQNASTFGALSLDRAVTQMPRLQAPMLTTGAEEPAAVVANLRGALATVDALSSERAGLEEALKVEKNKDNILPKVMAQSSVAGSYDRLFAQELKKYDPLKAQVEANLAKQQGVLADIQRNQAAYLHIFGYREWRAACEAAAAGMKRDLTAFREVRENLAEGLRFYMSLQEAVATLAQQAGDFALTRRLQQQELEEAIRTRPGNILVAAGQGLLGAAGRWLGGREEGAPPPRREDMEESMRTSVEADQRRRQEEEGRLARERAQAQLAAMHMPPPAAPGGYGPPPTGSTPAAHAYPPQSQQAAASQPYGQQTPHTYQMPPAQNYPPPPQYYSHPPQQPGYFQPPPGNYLPPPQGSPYYPPQGGQPYYANPYATPQPGQQPPPAQGQGGTGASQGGSAPQGNPLWGSR